MQLMSALRQFKKYFSSAFDTQSDEYVFKCVESKLASEVILTSSVLISLVDFCLHHIIEYFMGHTS